MTSSVLTDVLVVGAGPAGMAAAAAAAENGRNVVVVDDNRKPGGQIWRESSKAFTPSTTRRIPKKQQALDRLQRSGARILTGCTVFNASTGGFVDAMHETPAGSAVLRICFQQLILATGARERFLPFPGWTLPGVFGVGGLQALVRAGYPVAGKRVVVAGTGPLLLAVAAHLAHDGAHISTVVEQARFSALAAFAISLWRHPAKFLQGASYRFGLRSTEYLPGCWITEAIASSDGRGLSAVRVTDGKLNWTEPCDLLACAYHLVPNTEVAELLGCAFDGSFVRVDAQQQTSVPNIYCVGEPTGITGLDGANVQGEIAGLACSGQSTAAFRGSAHKARAFAKKLEQAFTLREELKSLAAPETIVCRCEDVRFASLQGHEGWLDIKLQTRCGMGPCQGRVCGPAIEFLFGSEPTSVRQPLSPVPLHALYAAAIPLPQVAAHIINERKSQESE